MLIDKCNNCEINDQFGCYLPEFETADIVMSYISLFITAFAIIFMPIKIIRKQEIIGVSLPMLQMTTIALECQLVGIIYTEFPHFAALPQHGYNAFIALSPAIALITMLVSFLVSWIAYIYVWNKKIKQHNQFEQYSSYVKQVIILVITQIILLICISVAIIMLLTDCHQSVANQVMGLIYSLLSAIITAIEFLPQIKKTYQLKTGGAMSLLSNILQIPSNIITLATFFMDETSIIAATQLMTYTIFQFILCCMQFKYDFIDIKFSKYYKTLSASTEDQQY